MTREQNQPDPISVAYEEFLHYRRKIKAFQRDHVEVPQVWLEIVVARDKFLTQHMPEWKSNFGFIKEVKNENI